jgi:hypothetical protein
LTGRVRIGAIVLVLLGFLAIGPLAAARAHDSNHPFESTIRGVFPTELSKGITVEVLDYDSRLRLENRSGKPVVVEGYAGEPYARIDPDGGVYLNARSPALYLNNDRYAQTPVDPGTDPEAPAEWFRIDGSGELTWYEHRSHSMKVGTPAQVDDPSSRTKLRDYSVPVIIGGSPARIDGTLYWTGTDQFPVVATLILLFATAAAALFGAVVIRRLNRSPEAGTGGKETRKKVEPTASGEPESVVQP